VPQIAEHFVDPRPGGVHDELGMCGAGFAVHGAPLDTGRAPSLHDDPRHARVGLHDRAVRRRVEHVLDD